MPRVKIVMYHGTVRAYLDGIEVPPHRLADMTPILINKVSTGQALVLEGEAWADTHDQINDILGDPVNPEPVEEARTGCVVVRDYGGYVELEITYQGRKHVLRYEKDKALASAISPYILSLRIKGKLDPQLVSALHRALRANPVIKKILRELRRSG